MVELYKILSTLVKYKTEPPVEGYLKYQQQIEGTLFNYFEALGIQLPQQEKSNIAAKLYGWFIDFQRLIQQKKELE